LRGKRKKRITVRIKERRRNNPLIIETTAQDQEIVKEKGQYVSMNKGDYIPLESDENWEEKLKISKGVEGEKRGKKVGNKASAFIVRVQIC